MCFFRFSGMTWRKKKLNGRRIVQVMTQLRYDQKAPSSGKSARKSVRALSKRTAYRKQKTENESRVHSRERRRKRKSAAAAKASVSRAAATATAASSKASLTRVAENSSDCTAAKKDRGMRM